MGVVRKSSVCATVTDGSVAMSCGLELGPADLQVMKEVVAQERTGTLLSLELTLNIATRQASAKRGDVACTAIGTGR
jgi:hypothetical protein